nr:MAG: DNA pilot protein [Microvirus sp.]
MAPPAVYAPIAAKAGSSFLTSPIAGGIAAGVTQGIFNKASSKSFRSRNRDMRKNYQYQERYLPNIQSALFKQKIADVKAAGLHPLAALGVSFGGSGSAASAPDLAGQNNTGSAIGAGLETAQRLAGTQSSQAHGRQLAGLQLQEQQLRNDWLAQQIKHGTIKMAAQLANVGTRSSNLEPGPGPQQPGAVHFSETQSMPTGKTTSAEAVQNRYGEGPEQAQGLLNIGYDVAGATLPKSFGDWWIDNITNAKRYGAPKSTSTIVKKPYRRPKYVRTPKRYTSRFRTTTY